RANPSDSCPLRKSKPSSGQAKLTMTDTTALKSNPAVLRIYQAKVKLSRQNGELVGLCPFHKEKSGSFKVSQADGAYVFKCFGCGVGGDVIRFVEKTENLSFKAAVKWVEDFLGQTWQAKKEQVEQTFKNAGTEEQAKQVVTMPLAVYAKKFERALAQNEK